MKRRIVLREMSPDKVKAGIQGVAYEGIQVIGVALILNCCHSLMNILSSKESVLKGNTSPCLIAVSCNSFSTASSLSSSTLLVIVSLKVKEKA